jgi:hypothetical protein
VQLVETVIIILFCVIWPSIPIEWWGHKKERHDKSVFVNEMVFPFRFGAWALLGV